jgi:predicted nucleotidyltransferase
MELSALQAIAHTLNEHHADYVIVGGMAVVAHGYGRMTFDVDLVIRLDKDNILRTFSALGKIGYQPRVPVTAEQFADPVLRAGWIRDKGMMVLNLWSDHHRDTPVDIFVTEPFDFTKVHGEALVEALPDGTLVRIVALDTLIEMKRAAGREKDRDDIRHLELLRDET